MPFLAACAQFTPKKADVAANLQTIADLAVQSSEEGASLVVFPETATSGYFLEGGVSENSLEGYDLTDRLSRLVQGRLETSVDVLVGFYERWGGNLYNSAAYIELGPQARLVHVYRKFFLPTYGVFDEERFVSRGQELGVFDTRLGKMGVLICEDVWHSVLPTLCAVRGAQTILVPSASPARGFSGDSISNHDRYERMLRAVSEEHGVFCVNCQLSGFEGGKGFVGGSMIIGPMGQLIAKSPLQEDHLLLGEIDPELSVIARAQTPLISDLQAAWKDIVRLATNC